MRRAHSSDSSEEAHPNHRAWEVFWTFLKIGALSFGGPAATQGLVYAKAVAALKWLREEEFHRLLGMVNIIPGPNAVQMAMYIGRRRAGGIGFVLGGLAFVLPGALISALLAAGHVRYGGTPPVEAVLYGVKPVVIAVIAWSVLRLGRGLGPSPPRLCLMGLAAALYLAGLGEIAILGLCGLLVLGGRALQHLRDSWSHPLAAAGSASLSLPLWAGHSGSVDLPALTGVFLKAGLLLFGGGTLLLAVLNSELVAAQGWLTRPQLLEAVAIGHMTPGSVLTTATFIGYLLAGTAGAVGATAAVLAPSFLLMTLAGPLMRAIGRSPSAQAFLDGVTLAVVGIVAALLVELGRDALVDALTAAVALCSLALLLWRPALVLPLLACGALAGLLPLLVSG